ncbi:eukaryotic translation initiation factor 3 subunit M-like [Pollicipes pollicipes]|uniref:eukaryotic translation initiation factor 3 subunit M-like n=1 Tax=Pollicipes pollicipes TaxID=41117 RepID=UPI0018851619|nr:eukaryotic translation initiation factor 3 subunit M-like [Pollicipes pollicipes]
MAAGASESNQLLAFIKIELADQALELQSYLQSKGADIPAPSSEDLHEDLSRIIEACDVCFASSAPADVEAVLNSIVSMIILETVKDNNKLIVQFCAKLSAATTCQEVCLKVTNLLFNSLKPSSPVKYDVYYSLVSLAGKVDQIDSVFSSIPEMEAALGSDLTVAQKQKLLRLIYRELLNNKHSEAASVVMIDLLRTYSEETASEAREEAQRCVLAALADPDTYLLDHLLSLKPVQSLEGSPVYQLLTIFISEGLAQYQQFYAQHKDLVESWGLNHANNETKMRQLTFMQLAQAHPDMPFDMIEKELQVPEKGVEEFVIEVLRTRLVRGRMDQAARKVHISSTMHRTFARPQWQQLRDVLTAWKANVSATCESMQSVVMAQMEMMGQLSNA